MSDFDEVCTAIRTAFPGAPLDRFSHGTCAIGESEEALKLDAESGSGDDRGHGA